MVGVVLKAVEVLVTKKQFVMNSPIMAQVPPPAMPMIQQGYDPAVGAIFELAMTLASATEEMEQMTITEIRNHLAQYLFREEDVFKLVGGLSGGERGRLALAILALQGANFLLLDEPTNHLDIPAQEVLQEVLAHFTGTTVLISHDRYLISQLATQIWHLNNGHLTVYREGYRAFTIERAREIQIAKVALAAPKY